MHIWGGEPAESGFVGDHHHADALATDAHDHQCDVTQTRRHDDWRDAHRLYHVVVVGVVGNPSGLTCPDTMGGGAFLNRNSKRPYQSVWQTKEGRLPDGKLPLRVVQQNAAHFCFDELGDALVKRHEDGGDIALHGVCLCHALQAGDVVNALDLRGVQFRVVDCRGSGFDQGL